MNDMRDFHKEESGIVINTNTKDYLRSKRRNKNLRNIHKVEKIDNLEKEIRELKQIINELRGEIIANTLLR